MTTEPEPFKVGDQVRHARYGSMGTVLEVRGLDLLVRPDLSLHAYVYRASSWKRIPDAELLPPVPEPEWRDSKDPKELERAIRDDRRVEVSYDGGKIWWLLLTSKRTADEFSRDISVGFRYRIGPA